MAKFAMAKGAHANNKSMSAVVNPQLTVNKAGGEAFLVADPSTRMLTMLGSSLWNEPTYYGTPADGANASSAASGLSHEALQVLETAREIARGDSPRDLLALAHWARAEMNIRTTPQILLAVAANEPKTKPYVRAYASKIVARADEVRQVFAAHLALYAKGVGANAHGQKLPNSLKRGLADAMSKFSESQLMKYDSDERPTFRDVLKMIDRSKDRALPQGVYKYLMTGEVSDPAATPVIAARKALAKKTVLDDEARALIAASHANWEVVVSQFGSKREVWDLVAPQLGYMALLRNLRNLLQAGVDPGSLAERIADAKEVARSKQLPFRFYSAWKMLSDAGVLKGANQVIGEALDAALAHAARSLPRISGVTAIASDNSGSMGSPVSAKSIVTVQAAANLLAAMALRVSDDGHVMVFGEQAALVKVSPNDSILRVMNKQASTNVGHATNTHRVLELMLAQKLVVDRLIVLSDMQCYDSSGGSSTFSAAVAKYREKLNPALFVHSIDLVGYGKSALSASDPRVNLVSGFSEKILRTVVDFELAYEQAAAPAGASSGVYRTAEPATPVASTLDDIRARF
jgi:hypothetical protein